MGSDLTTTGAVISWGRLDAEPDQVALAARLAPLVTVASDAARSATSRQLSRAVYADLYAGRARERGGDALRNGTRIYLREYPVNSIASITENGVSLTLTTG